MHKKMESLRERETELNRRVADRYMLPVWEQRSADKENLLRRKVAGTTDVVHEVALVLPFCLDMLSRLRENMV